MRIFTLLIFGQVSKDVLLAKHQLVVRINCVETLFLLSLFLLSNASQFYFFAQTGMLSRFMCACRRSRSRTRCSLGFWGCQAWGKEKQSKGRAPVERRVAGM